MNVVPYLIAAGIGFALSVMGGIFGGVGFGETLLRALMSAVVFGGGAYGLGLLLQRMFPELFEELNRPAPGEGLDLRVGGDSDLEMPPPDSGAEFAREIDHGVVEEVEPDAATADRDILSHEGEELGEIDQFDQPGGLGGAGGVQDSGEFSTLGGVDGKDGVLLDGIDDDPAALARAVQTVLKKDSS